MRDPPSLKRVNTHNNRNIQHHIRNIPLTRRKKRINQLPQRPPQRIRQRHHRRRRHAPIIREPQIAIVRRRRQDEGLREPRQDLAEHDDAVVLGAGAAVADPVPDEEKDGGGYDGGFGTAFVEDVDGEGCCDAEGEEEAGAEPVYSCH